MITLTGGHIQGPNNVPVPNGTVELILSQDAQVIASPFGQVMGNIPVIFGFDVNGNLLAGAQIWSNTELTPAGTAYLVNFYDKNGARVNANPFTWVFTQSSGSSVDIGTIQTTPTFCPTRLRRLVNNAGSAVRHNRHPAGEPHCFTCPDNRGTRRGQVHLPHLLLRPLHQRRNALHGPERTLDCESQRRYQPRRRILHELEFYRADRSS